MRLLSAGMRIIYAGLLKAAGDMVAGVEVWVQAQQQLGIQSDIPALAVAVCCGGDWADIELPAEDGGALLQLALNCSNPDTATAAARRMPALLEPGVARSLLLTAATRQHSKAVKHMRGSIFEAIFLELPGAQQLSNNAVLDNLHKATTSGRAFEFVYRLQNLPAAAGISSAEATSLLQEAFSVIPPGEAADWAIRDLVEFSQAVSEPNSAEVAELLHAAAEHCCAAPADHSVKCLAFKALRDLPAAQQLSSEQVLQPLKVVVPSNARCTDALCQLPAAQQLSSKAVAQLLQAAAQGRSLQCMEKIC
ncbi:hypothetical protein COO60DRAFT_1649584 [Scenedesmus sp. NREL 46B-D3]|nr:hypothetical protein COO60DRAFT_1649584 [Scenedesmus sp. NREL 46B-D3]